MATSKRPAAKKKCGPCRGTGEISRPVQVGRKRRTVGHQTGMCLKCFGTGQAATT
ncbi:hypothetical protein [Streptomyces indicus]|uniref:Uncharacterized protein n=1 Tax=Streptomyces indicus TaxID=417292 RepID=A0A1G9GCD5_9ACTN|nr:hypothetical protein [Streptomyces indicus]SDK98221.1 hypothetical protein SAMN05421806_115121 [Streptomyces indicus]